MASMENPCVLVALFLIFLTRIIVADDTILTVNVKKPVAIVSEKFLSMTLDPAVLLTGDVLTGSGCSSSSTERSNNMARGLAPAYVRLGGSQSNSYTFERALFPQDTKSDPDFTFSEAHWVLVQQWAERAGLEVIACIAPQQTNNGPHPPTWDPRNALDLISFSDHMGYNMSWQLGYECQTRCDISGNDLGRDVLRLRNMLDAFPRYSSSLIAGPDIVTFKSKPQLQYLQDYLNSAGPALSAITWHPDLAGISLDSDGVSLLQDNLAVEKDALYKVIGRSIAKKPLWIAESKSEECKRQFLGALVWARRLGNAAKLGIQVLMRQPDTSNLFHPTPDYWVSLLHKTLVGREVLDMKVTSGNKTHVHFYCQCTRPSSRYEKGSLTIFGLNLTPGKVVANLKGLKIKTMHKYILMPGYDNSNRMFAETVLLNNEPLSLVNEKDLPELNPVVVPSGKGTLLKLPSGGIGFWVVPGLKVKSCMSHEDEIVDKMLLKKLTKRLEEAEVEEDAGHEDEDDQDLYTDSIEERKSLIKQKKKKRKHRHSEEEEDERKFRKIDTKKELEKLEKLLKRRDNNNEERKSFNLKGRVGLLMFDESNEKKDDTLEDETSVVQLKASGKHDSGEEIRAKLEEYKNRLDEYENRKKVQEEMDLDFERKKINSKIEEDSKDVDTQKALEALKLISKVEQAMKSLNKTEVNAQIETLKKEHSNDPISDLMVASSENGEDLLEDELEKSEKTKRMIFPNLMIENQLSTILQLLANDSPNKERYEKNAPYDPVEMKETEFKYKSDRFKRDLDKLFGDDPLGLRRDSIFKKRSKNEEAKERRMERRHRKKEKEDALTRKEVQAGIFDPKNVDSIENNFFGFQQREPPANFPRGDVFLNTGTSSEERENDYEYVQDDDEMATDRKPDKKSKKKMKSKTKTPVRNTAEPDDTWIDDGTDGLDHAPNEFFENVKMPMIRINEKLKDYGELWEAESLQKGLAGMDDMKIQATDRVAEDVVKENHLDENMDKQAKETAVKKLLKYYDNSEVTKDEPEIEDFSGEKMGKRKQKLKSSIKKNFRNGKERSSHKNTKDQVKKKVKIEESESEEEEEDFGSMQFRNAEESEEEPTYEEESIEGNQKKKRTRRKISDLDSIFNNEMINQDDDNLKDCRCRVIRGGRWADQCKHYESKTYRKRRDLEESPNHKSPENSQSSERLTTLEIDSAQQYHVEVTEPTEDEGPEGMDLNSKTAKVVKASPSRTPDAESVLSVTSLVTEEKPIVGIIQEIHSEPASLTQEIPAEQVERLNKYSESEVAGNSNENPSVINTGQTKYSSVDIVEKPEVGSTFREKSEEEYKEMETNLQREAGASEKTSTLAMVRVPEVSQHLIESHSALNPTVIPVVDEISFDNTEPTANSADTKYLSNIQDQNEDTKVIEEAKRETGTETLKMEREINREEESKADEKLSSDATASLITAMKSDEDINIEQNRAARKMTEESTSNIPQVEINDRNTESVTEVKQSSSEKVELVGSTNVKMNDVIARNDKVDNSKEKPRTITSFEELTKAYESKVAAKSEALTNLRKESEMKKIEVKKVMETAKLKSTENAKYQEYQRRRAEKLEKLKEKLRAKRAKILQQYREELLEALSKCDSEVERNLKRREIWEEMRNHKDLQDVADKEKLAYIMMYKPMDYSSIKEESAEVNTQERRYIPEVEITRSLPDLRKQKVSVENRLYNFQDPKIIHYTDLLGTDRNFENSKKSPREEFNDEENLENSLQPVKSYYAIVESIENPKIIEESLLKDNSKSNKQNNYFTENNNNFLWANNPYEFEKHYKKTQCKDEHPNIDMDHNDLYEIPRRTKENLRDEKNEFKYWTNNPNIPYFHQQDRNHQDEDEKEILKRPLLAIDPSKYRGGEPKLEIHDDDETENALDDLEEDPEAWGKNKKNYYKHISQSPPKKYKNSDSPLSFVLGMADTRKDDSAKNSEENESLEYNSKKNKKMKKSSKYKSSDPTANDEHVPKAFYSNKRRPQAVESLKTEGYLENYKNPVETVKKSAFPIADIAEIEKYENRIDESVSVDPEETLANHSEVNGKSNVRVRRYLASDSNRLNEETSIRWRPLFSKSKLSKRKERNVEHNKCNYMCLKEDSSESSAEDQNRLFKLVKEEDHYKAVPVENVEIKEKHVSKKNLKSSEYSNSKKYTSPKYGKYVSQEAESEEITPRELPPGIVSFRKKIEHRPISPYEINDIIRNEKYNWMDMTKMDANKEYEPRIYKDMNPRVKSSRYVRKDSQEVEDPRQDYKDQSERISLKNSENHFAKMYDDGDFINKHQDLLVDLPKKYPTGIQVRFHQDEDGPSISNDDEMDSLDLDDALGSSKYELLMLIPVKSHKRSRHRREIGNEITRNLDNNNSSLNEVWAEVVGIKDNAKHLQDYVAKRKEHAGEFEKIQKNIDWYLKEMRRPKNKDNNFSTNPSTIGITENKVTSYEHPKSNILKTTIPPMKYDDPKATTNYEEEPENPTPTSFLEEVIPKIANELTKTFEKTGNLTNSIESFIDEFQGRFNDTLKNKENETIENLSPTRKITHNIFNTVITHVNKFFAFVSGLAHIFHRH